MYEENYPPGANLDSMCKMACASKYLIHLRNFHQHSVFHYLIDISCRPQKIASKFARKFIENKNIS